MISIRRWLLAWLLGGLLAAMSVATVWVYDRAHEEATELFDFALRELAVTLPSSLDAARLAAQDTLFNELSEEEVGTQVWVDNDVDPDYRWPENSSIPRLSPGLHTIVHDGVKWRVYGLDQPHRYVEVAQPIAVRDLLARRLATRTLLPILGGALLLTAFVWFVVSYGLNSLLVLSRRLANRSANDLEPLIMRAPDEIRPVVVALNGLLFRLNESQMAQRTFIADAAHELRSPLTALKLQLQLAESDATDPAQKAHLLKIDARLTRTIHLAEQLLALAREDAYEEIESDVLDLKSVVANVIGDLSVVAERKQVDLGVVGNGEAPGADASMSSEPLWVRVEPHGMRTLLWNIIDNAVRYTPAGGRVDVRVRHSQEGIAIDVIDDGPGIRDEDLVRVFDRFYRASDAASTGSGLGLSIVRKVAERMQLEVSLANRAAVHGLHVTISGFAVP